MGHADRRRREGGEVPQDDDLGHQVVGDAEDDEGGIVVDYFWRNSNEQAYKDFQPSQQSTNQYSEDIANDLWNADSVQGCADFLDADGVLGGGLVSIGDHGRPFPDSDGQTDEQIRYCESLRST